MDINKLVCDSFIDGYKKGKEDMLVKAREWLNENLYEHTNEGEFVGTLSKYVYKEDTINQFLKAMIKQL